MKTVSAAIAQQASELLLWILRVLGCFFGDVGLRAGSHFLQHAPIFISRLIHGTT